MLILSRKVGEVIYVGDAIEIHVMQVDRGGRVRIGIKAPADTRIDRAEVRLRINAERDLIA
jgi:carbon storage regulator